MKGDFSQWGLIPSDNFSGVLQQQGRVSLDQDWNAATLIEQHWRHRAGEDAIGAGVVGVPAAVPNSFKVTQATATATGVQVTLQTGRAWDDGVHLYYTGTTPLTATYLAPPLQTPQATVGTIAAGVRDAVILEVWDESFSAFQDPRKLLEPALGGPDTTERVQTSMALKLMRLSAGDDCGNLHLADDFNAKGKLTVTPSPTVVIAGPCPVPESGGYNGFEHYLYRIEIAEPAAGAVRFKWSQFNGGLVGRGAFTATGATTGTVAVSANNQMINQCGLPSFYLEALAFDAALGAWRVVLTADATPPAADTLALTNIQGSWPAGTSAFFRLWNGVVPITAFPPGLPLANELKDGIRLAFDAALAGNSNYTPGDYWTFPVRTAGVDFDPSVWPNNAPPQGVHYHRAPLAIITWSAPPTVTVTAAAGQIHDCRRVFQPLTKLQTCCTLKVGDGLGSFGDYDSIQTAIDALPANGGEVCVLPGVYVENINIANRRNITIRGCGERSRIQSALPAGGTTAVPVIHIDQSANIRIEGLAIVAHSSGIGIHVEGQRSASRQLVFHELILNAALRSAVQIDGGRFITITQCRVRMDETPSPWPGVFVIGEDVLIERNTILVQRAYVLGTTASPTDIPGPASAGRGGLQLGGLCERVRVVNNLIQGGIGNGITLGTIRVVKTGGSFELVPWIIDIFDPCSPCDPGDSGVPSTDGEGTSYESAGPLYDITIERNRIYDMGLNGIGVVGFFDLSTTDEFITVVRLNILGNDIRRCLRRSLAPISTAMTDAIGYGGIALADVEYLVIRDNLIEGNGRNNLEPICGIFILHVEGVEIVRNRILYSGTRTQESDGAPKAGRRGGINIVYGVANTVPVHIGNNTYPRQDGVPAIKIHDNIVSHALGQALSLTALGPVSVVANQFTSQGVMLGQLSVSPSFIAGCVQIMNLGVSNEWYAQLTNFSGALNGTVVSGPAGPDITDDAVLVPRAGLDDRRVGQYLANGNVLFSNNQCMLDLIETGFSLSLSSIFIFSFDDVAFVANQCDCNLRDDFTITQAIIFGISSARIADNRFKEGWYNALYSAVTFGLMNATTNNQATHCLLIGGPAALKVDDGNRVLRATFDESYRCAGMRDSVAAGGATNLEMFR